MKNYFSMVELKTEEKLLIDNDDSLKKQNFKLRFRY